MKPGAAEKRCCGPGLGLAVRVRVLDEALGALAQVPGAGQDAVQRRLT